MKRRSCLRHLWSMCHQVAEGLPDSFVFGRVGAGKATLDIRPRRTPTARSPVEDVVEVDSDSDVEAAKETQDRIIAGVAMSAAAVNAPDVRAVIGPGASAGPMRFCHLLRRSTFGGNTGRCRCSKGWRRRVRLHSAERYAR